MDLDIGVAQLSAIDEGDFVGVTIDGLGETPGLPPFELLHSYGFVARPLDPDTDGKGCSAFYATQGSEGFAWLANDPRIQTKLPNIRKGESLWYGPKGQFGRMHEDGSITLYTTEDGTPNGFGIFLRVSPTVTEASGRVRGGFEFVSPWGTFSFGPDGFHVVHSSGARFDLGAIAGLPAPLNAIASYATLAAGVVSIQGSAVAQGTDGGATHTAALTTLITLLTTLAAAIDSKNGPTTTTTAAVAAAAPVLTQIGAVV